ncbi:hypothetical protein D3C71_2190510 [compost metagenome]
MVEERFEAWVKLHIRFRKITETDKEERWFPPAVETCIKEEYEEMFNQKKKEIEYAFAEQTGVFIEFTGGLILE